MMEQTEEAPSLINAEEESCEKDKAWCLQRVGRDSDWLLLHEDSEVLVYRIPCFYLPECKHADVVMHPEVFLSTCVVHV